MTPVSVGDSLNCAHIAMEPEHFRSVLSIGGPNQKDRAARHSNVGERCMCMYAQSKPVSFSFQQLIGLE